MILKPISRGYINRALDKNARRYEKVDTENVSTFSDPYDNTYFCEKREIFEDLIQVEFENKYYPAPRKYDYWLRTLYGNYMELPPKENRVGHHTFEAYYDE